MKKQTTDEALKELLSKRGVYKDLGVSENTLRSWRKRIEEGKQMDEGKKMEILRLAGYQIVQERMWAAKIK